MKTRRKTYPARECDRTLEWQNRRLAGIRAHCPNYADQTLAFHRQLVHDILGCAFLGAVLIGIILLAFS